MTDIPISFTLEFVDNITSAVNRIEGSVDQLDKKLDSLRDTTTKQNVSFLAQVTAVRSVDAGFRGLINVGSELGMMSDGLERGMRKLSTAVHGVSSAYQLLKGARQILIMLRTAEQGVAVVESFRLGLKGKIGMVMVGISAAAAAGGYFAGRSSVDNSTNVSQHIAFSTDDTPSNRAMARDTLMALGGY